MTAADSRKALRKFKFERQVGRMIVNPLVGALDKIGIRASSTVELETTGAKTGQPSPHPFSMMHILSGPDWARFFWGLFLHLGAGEVGGPG